MDPIKKFRRKRRLKMDGEPKESASTRHRDRMIHEDRRSADEVSSPPHLIPSRGRWASSPRFIKSGSHVFDEVFRIGMGFPAGMGFSFSVLDMRRLAAEQLEAGGTSLAAVGGTVGVFAFGAFLIAPVCIVWGLWRQARLKAIRKRREQLPEPIRWLGLPAMFVGMVCYLIVRTY
jgi:hypothetical protein